MIKKFFKKIVLGEKANSKKYVDFLKNKGIEVGKDVRFYSPSSTYIDIQNPYLLSIGDHVRITHGVIILTHDYSWSIIKKIDGSVLGAQSAVKIGNNVFIGMNAVITRGVTVGNNVIIGAGSVVTKNCESNSVYAGNPARRIMSIEDYAEKRRSLQFVEAKGVALAYRNKFNENPKKEIFREYFMLFSSAEEIKSCPEFDKEMKNCENYSESIAYINNNPPMFENFEEFLKACYE